jgi:hypothetical protein
VFEAVGVLAFVGQVPVEGELLGRLGQLTRDVVAGVGYSRGDSLG